MNTTCSLDTLNNTWSFDSFLFSRFSITEILVIPSFQIHKTLIEVSRQFSCSFFLDTIGNLSIYNNFHSLNLQIVNVRSIRKFCKTISRLIKNPKLELLVIDSVSFLSDSNVPIYTYFYSLLSELCVKNKCTIICTNHYRKVGRNSFGPKLGLVWSNLVKHRICYKYEKNNLIYEVIHPSSNE